MRQLSVWRPGGRLVGLVQAALLLAAGTALADGGPSSAASDADRVVARATFQCRGGVRVEVTVMPSTAQVDFAGQRRTLNQVPGAKDGRYQNTQLAWFTKGKYAYMQDRSSGAFELSDCAAVKQ